MPSKAVGPYKAITTFKTMLTVWRGAGGMFQIVLQIAVKLPPPRRMIHPIRPGSVSGAVLGSSNTPMQRDGNWLNWQ